MSHLLLSSFVVHACLRYSSRLFFNNLFFVLSACDASRYAYLTLDRYSLAHVEQVRAANQALAVKEQIDVVVHLVSFRAARFVFRISDALQVIKNESLRSRPYQFKLVGIIRRRAAI